MFATPINIISHRLSPSHTTSHPPAPPLAGSKLLVRSGSDPRGGSGPAGSSSTTGVRRSSLLGAMNGRRPAAEDDDSDESDDYTKPGPRKTGGPSGAPGSEAFARSAARQSLGNNPALLRWLDAQVSAVAVRFVLLTWEHGVI